MTGRPAAEAAASKFGALATHAFGQSDRGAWGRPVRVVSRSDVYALLAAAGLDYAYEMYTQLHATPDFPLMVAARLPDSQVLRHLVLDYVDVLQSVDREDPTHGTPRLPMKANGSGDITAALFTGHLKETASPADALARTASSVFAVLKETLDSGERELRLIAAQDAIASPASEFEVAQVR